MKTYVLLVSKKFLAGHPKRGKPTWFKEKLLCGALYYDAKLHTIRGNFQYWDNIVDEVNAGRAVLSLRQWKGKPYKSKQEEFLQVKKLGIQLIEIKASKGLSLPKIMVDGKMLQERTMFKLMANDGLSDEDFMNWFTEDFIGAIIHFSRLRY